MSICLLRRHKTGETFSVCFTDFSRFQILVLQCCNNLATLMNLILFQNLEMQDVQLSVDHGTGMVIGLIDQKDRNDDDQLANNIKEKVDLIIAVFSSPT